MKIGILLPKSSTHPLIGHDFLTGLKLSLTQGDQEGHEIISGKIGFGVDEELIYSETERLFLEEGVDLLIAYADHPKIGSVFPLLKALNKLLIVVNSGAKYPESWNPQENVLYLTLNELINCRLTGKVVVEEGYGKGVMATSFYDGGYSLCHALVEGFADQKGQIEYNFINKLHADLDASPVVDFLKGQPDKIALLSVFSGELAYEFFKQIQDSPLENAGIYASPTFLLDSWANIQKNLSTQNGSFFPPVKGFVSWWPDLDLPANRCFIETFRASVNREASAFSALGWDAGLICTRIMGNGHVHGFQAAEMIQTLKEHGIEGTRGRMHLDEATHHYVAPSYLVTLQEEKAMVSDVSGSEQQTWNELVQATEELPLTGWFNTYLCS